MATRNGRALTRDDLNTLKDDLNAARRDDIEILRAAISESVESLRGTLLLVRDDHQRQIDAAHDRVDGIEKDAKIETWVNRVVAGVGGFVSGILGHKVGL